MDTRQQDTENDIQELMSPSDRQEGKILFFKELI